MRKSITVTLAIVFTGAVTTGIVWRNQQSVEGKRAQLQKEFVACLPENYGDPRRAEIAQLFASFWYRYGIGMVDTADAEEITRRLHEVVDEGSIVQEDVAYLMAQVGYYTYKLDKHYTPSDTIDHPTLNPSSAMVRFGFDSTTWAEFYEWKKGQIKQGLLPGYELADTLPPPEYRQD